MAGLIAELCRVFNAKRDAIACAMRHGQVTVDGFIVREQHDRRWSEQQLRGRTAAIHYPHLRPPEKRQHRLYR